MRKKKCVDVISTNIQPIRHYQIQVNSRILETILKYKQSERDNKVGRKSSNEIFKSLKRLKIICYNYFNIRPKSCRIQNGKIIALLDIIKHE